MSTNFPRTLSLLFLLAAPGLAGCGESPPTPAEGPRLVVLYSTCTLNKDFLSAYDPAVTFTPNLARFASESAVFARHETESGQSGVSFASIYTGCQADRHGIYHHPGTLSDELLCIGEAFAEGGYETWFWSGQSLASAELGYGQGIAPENVFNTFVMFSKHAKELGTEFFERTTASGAELDRVLEGLTKDPEKRAFLQINFTITHELYHEYANLAEIERFRSAYPEHATPYTRDELASTLAFFEEHRHLLQLDHPRAVQELGLTAQDLQRIDGVLQLAYRACVHQLDRYFGRFLDKIRAAGLMEDSLIAFTADHGETFLRESEPLHWMHGLQLAPSVLSVPLLVRGPSAGVQPGRYENVTRSIDVFPTLAGASGIDLPRILRGKPGPDGFDLSPSLRGEEAPPRLHAFSHTTTLGPDRIARYRRNEYATVLSIMPSADPANVWVRVRDQDRIWEQRPTQDGAPGGVASQGGTLRTRCYDLAADPGRLTDLFDAEDPEQRAMEELLVLYRASLIEGFSPGTDMSQRETLKRLENLGYVGEESASESKQESEVPPR